MERILGADSTSRGTEVGATIHHPHGQIYAFPFIPPSPLREARVSAAHGCGVCAELGHEHDDERRIVARTDLVARAPQTANTCDAIAAFM